jgi:hypothetical protein
MKMPASGPQYHTKSNNAPILLPRSYLQPRSWRRLPRHGPPVHCHAINSADHVVKERLPIAGANGMVDRVAPQS